MRINSIAFKKPFIGRRYVAVALSTGNSYKIKRSGDYDVVVPPCKDGEKEALGVVYKAAWEWLNGVEGQTLDRGAKLACGRLVGLLAWPDNFTQDIQTRLEYVVNKVQFAENIF